MQGAMGAMGALADAAHISMQSSDLSDLPHPSNYGAAPYSDVHVRQAMAHLNATSAGLATNGHLSGMMGPPLPLPSGAAMSGLVSSGQLPGPGRHLQILDHTVHRIDAHTKANGEEEKEMVVSNLRHFTLKIGVLDPRMGMGRDAELPLKAELLYENGQLVEQLATCEPLLVGKTEVVAMQGTALFKLRITSLSSHRDKQRFRIRVSPVDTNLLLREPGLSVVTTPMKCVTKLSHRSSSGSNSKAGDAEGEGEEWDEADGAAAGNGAGGGGTKRKREDLDALLESQSQQLQELLKTNSVILEELRQLRQMLSPSSALPEP